MWPSTIYGSIVVASWGLAIVSNRVADPTFGESLACERLRPRPSLAARCDSTPLAHHPVHVTCWYRRRLSTVLATRRVVSLAGCRHFLRSLAFLRGSEYRLNL